MDPVTHALVGAATARVALARPLGRAAWLPGAVGALLPDADTLIRSASDPLLYAEFHRHFTHSVAFIPLGGTMAALPWLLVPGARARWKWCWSAAVAGYATHGLLDASTTYGTMLLWPFSDARVAWHWISILDPLFTAVLIAGVGAALWRHTARPVAVALALCLTYLTAGAVQRERALDVQARVAASRGHQPARGEVFPGFLTNIVWRSMYEAEGAFHMDRIRVPWMGAPAWIPATSVAALEQDRLPADVQRDPRLARDFRRFHRFTGGWVARSPREPDLIGDARYSSLTGGFEPVWGIRLDPSKSPPVEWIDRSGQRRIDVFEVWSELRGRSPGYRPVPAGPPAPNPR